MLVANRRVLCVHPICDRRPAPPLHRSCAKHFMNSFLHPHWLLPFHDIRPLRSRSLYSYLLCWQVFLVVAAVSKRGRSSRAAVENARQVFVDLGRLERPQVCCLRGRSGPVVAVEEHAPSPKHTAPRLRGLRVCVGRDRSFGCRALPCTCR
jgi:hypothetical protein